MSDDKPVPFYNLTPKPYGFAWGPVEVERSICLEDGVMLTITAAGGKWLHVWVSTGGRSLRVVGQGRRNKT